MVDQNVADMLIQVHEEVRYLRRVHEWPQLTKEFTFTLVAGQSTYQLPGDFDRWIFDTTWSRGQYREMLGPLSAGERQELKGGIGIAPGLEQRYWVMGSGINQLTVDPVPTASDDGQIVAFEYRSKNAIIPRFWGTEVTYAAGAYVFWNGNIYVTSVGGLSGITAPTHTTGDEIDGAGGVTWSYFAGEYTKIIADTDQFLINPDIIAMGAAYRFRRSKGLEYADLKAEYDRALGVEKSALSGARTITFGRTGDRHMIGWENAPWTGYGQDS